MSDVKRPSTVTSTYRYKRPPRRKQADHQAQEAHAAPTAAVAAPPPASDDRMPAPGKAAMVSVPARRRRKGAAWVDNGQEAPPEIKAFFDRMVRPGGALPPKNRGDRSRRRRSLRDTGAAATMHCMHTTDTKL